MKEELKTERLQIVVEPSVLRQIDDFRFDHRISSRSEAMRNLLLAGLSLQTKKAEAGATASAQ